MNISCTVNIFKDYPEYVLCIAQVEELIVPVAQHLEVEGKDCRVAISNEKDTNMVVEDQMNAVMKRNIGQYFVDNTQLK